MSCPSTGSVMPVGLACWNMARFCHWVPAPPDRTNATRAAPPRAAPAVAPRMLERWIPTARRLGPARTRSAMITLTTKEMKAIANPPMRRATCKDKRVVPLQLREEPHDRARDEKDHEREAEKPQADPEAPRRARDPDLTRLERTAALDGIKRPVPAGQVLRSLERP